MADERAVRAAEKLTHRANGCEDIGGVLGGVRERRAATIAAEYADVLAENERLKADLADAQYWRERHCTESAANAAQSGENWQRAKALEQQVAELREACEAAAAYHESAGRFPALAKKLRAALKKAQVPLSER